MKGSDLSGLFLLRLGMAVAVMFVAEAYVGLARALAVAKEHRRSRISNRIVEEVS